MFIVHTFSNRTDTEYRQYRTNSSTYLTEHLAVRVIQLIASLIDLLRWRQLSVYTARDYSPNVAGINCRAP